MLGFALLTGSSHQHCKHLSLNLSVMMDAMTDANRNPENQNGCYQTTVLHSLPHLLFVLLVAAYILVGGVLFQSMERKQEFEEKFRLLESLKTDLNTFLRTMRSRLQDKNRYYELKADLFQLIERQETVFSEHGIRAADIFDKYSQVEESWTLANAILFAFTVVTTIGYGNLAPKTVAGRLACMTYALIGIPMTVLAIANIGKFLNEFFTYIYFGLKDKIFRRQIDAEDPPRQSPVLAILLGFTIYVLIGSIVLPLWENIDFFDSFYFTFITVTTCGFGDIVPQNVMFLFPTIVYITFGLAIGSLTIEQCAGIFRQIHYIFSPVRGAKHAMVWFGSKVLTAGELVQAVGRDQGISTTQLDKLLQNGKFDQLVTDAVADKKASKMLKKQASAAKTHYISMRLLAAPIFDDDEMRAFYEHSRSSSSNQTPKSQHSIAQQSDSSSKTSTPKISNAVSDRPKFQILSTRESTPSTEDDDTNINVNITMQFKLN